MTTFYDEVQAIRARYPEGSRSAALPALRLAQQKHGYLSREALEETADALDVTPAFCYSVATFYDMFHARACRQAHDRDLHESPVRAVRRTEGRRGVRAGARM